MGTVNVMGNVNVMGKRDTVMLISMKELIRIVLSLGTIVTSQFTVSTWSKFYVVVASKVTHAACLSGKRRELTM